jgi:hypothetical protein
MISVGQDGGSPLPVGNTDEAIKNGSAERATFVGSNSRSKVMGV